MDDSLYLRHEKMGGRAATDHRNVDGLWKSYTCSNVFLEPFKTYLSDKALNLKKF